MTLQEAMAAYNPQLMPQQPPSNVPAGYDPRTGIIAEAPWYDPNRQSRGRAGQGLSNMVNPLLALLMRLGGPGQQQQQQRTLASYSSNPYSGNNVYRGGY